MVRTSLGIGAAFVESAGQAVVDLVGLTVVTPGIVDIPPRPLRRVLIAFQSSIQGRIPEILGDDDEERIETLVALLDGTSEDDLNVLLAAAFEALRRLEADERSRVSHRDGPRRRRRSAGAGRARRGGRERDRGVR
jgi:hypothetical protein